MKFVNLSTYDTVILLIFLYVIISLLWQLCGNFIIKHTGMYCHPIDRSQTIVFLSGVAPITQTNQRGGIRGRFRMVFSLD